MLEHREQRNNTYKAKGLRKLKVVPEFNIVIKEGHDTTNGLKLLEASYIEHVYLMCRYNQVQTAKRLGISRGCLRMKLREYWGDTYL